MKRWAAHTVTEWEYACRAGSAEPQHGALDAISWHGEHSRNSTREVGLTQPVPAGPGDRHVVLEKGVR